MESLEFQSPSLINTVQNNLELLECVHQQDMTKKLLESQNFVMGMQDQLLMEKPHMQEFLFKKCNGIMGVPITFLDKYNPEQFEIVAFRKGNDGKDLVFTRERENSTILSNPYKTSIAGMIKNAEGKINGKPTYARITIRKRKENRN